MVSIIVPVYNAASYLSKCITSILNQSYQNLECILVNDGSIDNSLDICLEWARKDTRVQVIDQKNGGVSVARNQGIQASRGEFILFVDSDDTIDRNTVSYLVKEQAVENVDIVVFGLVRHFRDGHISKSSGIHSKRKLTFEDFIANFWDNYEDELTNSPTNKLFKTNIIKQHQIEFPLGMKMGEDLLFNLAYLEHVKEIFVTDQHFYHYQLHDGQATFNIDLRVADDMIIFLTEIDRLKHQVESKSDCKVNWQEHYYQIFKHILTAINMGYRSKLSTEEQKQYLATVVQQFDQQFDLKKLVAKTKSEQIILSMIQDKKFNQLHTYLKITHASKQLAKRIIKK
ncbi:glycosyltransferase family 2 protein [Aerococcus urinaeequi]|uniref:glycosyltransferase family 2 protein n=1 Tax=Aerococcus urinaeequi TaxID=51665 RepID=UPI00288DC54C|nr:glycosyltransferase [Aerococcus urinaeequi]MDT2761839.1 glycosyltransferase [Aerococcus urinaeequi]